MQKMKVDMKEMKNELKEVKSEQQRQGDLLHQLIQTVDATNTRLDSMESKFNKRS
ncbi:hypothetical protein J8TS2_11760 [Lederbergia ruris]|uniref:Uncharacterized protein n=2 Tax=Lederbergia ruris TaxID=217495 RepID=A0ABQ4KG34_9BACI|nr:hypothetical protein J8TS2_11760 [Lederbergia ruris]